MEVEPQILSERTNDGDSMTSRLDPDTMQNEQTWPTEEEMQGVNGEHGSDVIPAAGLGITPKAIKKVKVPKGTSAYQAAWIVDDGDGGDDDDEYETDDDGSGPEEMEEIDADGFKVPLAPGQHPDNGAEDDAASSSRRSVAFEDLDMEEEGKQCVAFCVSYVHRSHTYSSC